MDFETLLKQWANEQGFQTWSQDHAAVLGNLAKWLNQHAAQQSFAGGQLPLCPECKETLLEDDRRWECVNESCGNCR